MIPRFVRLLSPLFFIGAACPASGATVHPAYEPDALVRNPGSGWILYDDAAGKVTQADAYWKVQDKAAREHASIFYVRWRWSDMEPTEGRYAWKYDRNFQELIAGAKARGLRLAFRVYVCGWDNAKPATPEFVFKAGAKGQGHPGAGGKSFLTPNADDPVFRAKLEKFIAAFAAEFDDPKTVDFIDGCGLGRWGEGHSLTLGDGKRVGESLKWVAETYAKYFKKTLLGWQIGGAVGARAELNTIIRPLDFVVRRDGLGSRWMDNDIGAIREAFPRNPLFAERCYWGAHLRPDQIAGMEPRLGKNWKGWKDIDTAAVDQAIELHANTLDLRTVVDTARFMSYPDLVLRFRREGGYRLAPDEVTCPDSVKAGETFEIKNSWRNHAVGVLPNLNRRWGSKYRPAWALFDEAGRRIVGTPTVASDVEPGEWLKGKAYPCVTKMTVPAGTPAGRYRIACAILNTTKDGMPDLNLALKSPRHGSWYFVGETTVAR